MRKIYLLLLGLVFLSACFQQSYPQQPIIIDPDLSEKEVALAFSLRIVESYFDRDCDFFYDSIGDVIYTFDNREVHSKDEIDKEDLCGSLDSAVRGDYTYEDYLNFYNYVVLDKEEYEREYPQVGDLQFTPDAVDYLFVGSEAKGDLKFIWDDMYAFTVANTKDGWRITGVSG